MSDFYTEQLIKRKASAKDTMIKAALTVLSALSVLAAFLFPVGILVAAVVIVITVLMFHRLRVEYEYLFVNGDLDIDKIMNESKRKRVFSTNIESMELLVPVGAGELMQFQRAKVFDYTSNTGSDQVYALIVADGGMQKKILFEPNADIVEGFFMLAPRKVVRKR